MRIISRRTLREFYCRHAEAKPAIDAWFSEVSGSTWSGPAEIRSRYPSADFLPGNRVIFNIKGNTYRLIVKIHYNTGIVYIRFVGTHADYDRIDATTI